MASATGKNGCSQPPFLGELGTAAPGSYGTARRRNLFLGKRRRPGDVVPVEIYGRPVGEADFEAAALGHGFMGNYAYAIGHAALFRGRSQRANYQSVGVRNGARLRCVGGE
jgi:hypothetical protein